ncbi:hypothetical protein, partial [Rhodovulum marinum]|uniref:hypothetical protein n=1 Tax=Rhodovulum marinum TaxID=320662 RepID=UPI00140553E7
AIRSRFAGHTSRSAKTPHALRLKPDHFIGAGQPREMSGLKADPNAIPGDMTKPFMMIVGKGAITGWQPLGSVVETKGLIRHDLTDGLTEAAALAGNLQFVLIRQDDFWTSETAHFELEAFRQECPSIPIILTTADTTRNSFALEHLHLADVILREPFDASALEFAILVAPINNEIWQERMCITNKTPAAARGH